MYQATIPVFLRGFSNLSAILTKAEEDAAARKIDPSVFTSARLAPDMYPLTSQIQIATDVSKGCAARLAGLEIPSYEDNEKTFDELHARIAKTVAFLQSIKPEQIDGTDDKPITIKTRGREVTFPGQTYLLTFVLPNFYFHLTTAYDILRHNGVVLGKPDFIGKLGN
jgi:hypothetical protein